MEVEIFWSTIFVMILKASAGAQRKNYKKNSSCKTIFLFFLPFRAQSKIQVITLHLNAE